MDGERDIIRKISLLTTEMETKYPELYRFLEEHPVGGSGHGSHLSTGALKSYLEDLKAMLMHYREAHKGWQDLGP